MTLPTCPTCHGEGKVRTDVMERDKQRLALSAQRRELVVHSALSLARGLLVLSAPLALLTVLVLFAYAASWAIGLPLQSPGWDHQLGPNVFLIGAGFLGTVGGVVLSIIIAVNLKWSRT